jgi:hypothetical protein
MKTFHSLSVIVLSLGVFASCQKKIEDPINAAVTSSDATAAVVTNEYMITQKVTDPNITTCLAEHFVSVQTGGVLKNVLYVFLPGTSRNPSVCKATTRKAASLGYHSIGLMYDNTVAGNPLCSATGDVTCHSRARREVIDGIDRHPSVNVTPANSLINRLYKLLVYLNNTRPTQGWGQYILNGKPNWSKIIIAGHSQGGAIAGVIGKYYPVKKVIMFSMIDYLNNGQTPDWETLPANSANYYALTNSADELVPWPKVQKGWISLKMDIYGPKLNVDWNPYPYQNTHTLLTTITPTYNGVDKYHNGTGVDVYIPKNSAGKYVYDKAWEYLITH